MSVLVNATGTLSSKRVNCQYMIKSCDLCVAAAACPLRRHVSHWAYIKMLLHFTIMDA